MEDRVREFLVISVGSTFALICVMEPDGLLSSIISMNLSLESLVKASLASSPSSVVIVNLQNQIQLLVIGLRLEFDNCSH